jgi:PAS domain S-box-containing protein
VSLPEDGAEPAVVDFLDTVANALPVMFNAKDTQSRYLFMNRYQAELYGVSTGDAVGRTADDLLGAEYGAYTRALDLKVAESGIPMPFFEETYAGVDGVQRHWLTSKVPLSDGGGNVWGVATVSIDITERRQLEEGLRQAKEQAEAAARARSGFLAAMSHELRTPLNAIGGYTELLALGIRGPINEQQQEDLRRIARNQAHLLSIINDILNFARVEAGYVDFTVEPIAATDVIMSVEPFMAPQVAQKQLRFTLHACDASLIMLADRDKAQQVLLNLLVNATKFTDHGGTIEVRAEGDDEAVRIFVSDTGVGIPSDRLDAIFEPFVQVHRSLTQPISGTGLGLSISRDLARRMGGDIDVESALGVGSTFTLILPRATQPTV